jgi:hypothetical protein
MANISPDFFKSNHRNCSHIISAVDALLLKLSNEQTNQSTHIHFILHSLLQLLSGKRRRASMPYRSMFTNPASGATIGTRAVGGATISPSLLSSNSPPTNFSDSA